MKKTIILCAVILSLSCTTTIISPMTQIEYTGRVSQEGISITAKPPFWGWCVDLYRYFTD